MRSEEAIELIRDARLSLHLATTVDDRPHVAPVWYVYMDGSLWITTAGKKLNNLRLNPRVAGSIEKYDEDGVHWNVHVLGTARIERDGDRCSVVRRGLDRKYSGPYATDGGKKSDEYGAGEVVEIRVGEVTGNRY